MHKIMSVHLHPSSVMCSSDNFDQFDPMTDGKNLGIRRINKRQTYMMVRLSQNWMIRSKKTHAIV